MLSERAKAFSISALLRDDKCYPRNSRPTAQPDQRCLSTEPPNGCERLGSGCPCYHNVVQSKTDPQTGSEIRAELCHSELWEAFHLLGTEMIITKTGRRMFPALRVKIDGLRTDRSYRIALHFVPVDLNKYRYIYHSSKWMVAGPGESMIPGQMYEHSDSPIEGVHLVNQVVSFERLKLTNSLTPKEGQVSLVSMQKFQPQIHVVEITPNDSVPDPLISPDWFSNGVVFSFPQTSFLAVTAYQNQEITRLKIARNPFAKGFREAGKTRSSLDTIIASFGFSLPQKISKDPCIKTLVKTEPWDIRETPRGQLCEHPIQWATPANQDRQNITKLSPLSCYGTHSSGYPPIGCLESYSPTPAHLPSLYSLEWSYTRQNVTESKPVVPLRSEYYPPMNHNLLMASRDHNDNCYGRMDQSIARETQEHNSFLGKRRYSP